MASNPESCPIPQELLEAAALWYRGGYTQAAPGGYIREYNPFHPAASRRGLVLQHRLVVERKIGRLLGPNEIVHHKNEKRDDNHPENLELFANHSEHMEHHHKGDAPCYDPEVIDRVRKAAANPKAPLSSTGLCPATVRKICQQNEIVWKRANTADLTEDQVREALQGRTTEEAAMILRVHFQTLYNRFDHLLDKRKKPGFLDDHFEDVCTIAKTHGIQEVARRYDTTHRTVYQAIDRWKKEGRLTEEIRWQGKRSLDQQREEVVKLLQEKGYPDTARHLGVSRSALEFAVKRWSEKGDLPDGFAPLDRRLKNRKLVRERMTSSQEPSLL
jgi:transposase